ncbi:MAG: 4-hydroxy-tetrahydrodipicolinate reductase [Proteobacteria bacterium]|nr:4-hydroxy-tetrahydrodipicolinate reductase [Pseudomonadota bacterium]
MKIGIIGCAGRMGRMLVKAVMETPGAKLAGGTEATGSSALGADPAVLAGLAPSGLVIGGDPSALFKASDVVIDFTAPAVTVANAKLAAKLKTRLVIGTTGLDARQQKEVAKAAKTVAIVQAANYSLGVNLLLGLTEQAAAVLGADYDIEIVEMHHRHKVDAPSGTALALGQAAATGRSVDLAKVSQRVRDGYTGPRRIGDIGFATLRGGMVPGEHSVIFAADGERVELTHKAADRSGFAMGAVRAALWNKGRMPGLYGMRDVLGFSTK